MVCLLLQVHMKLFKVSELKQRYHPFLIIQLQISISPTSCRGWYPLEQQAAIFLTYVAFVVCSSAVLYHRSTL